MEVLGKGNFLRDQVESRLGRNNIWVGPTNTGESVFVKRLLGDRPDVAKRVRRSLDMQRVLADHPEGADAAPALIGHDVDNGILVFENLEEAQPAGDLMVEDRFDTELAMRCGRLVGQLHETEPTPELDESRPLFPSEELLVGVPVTMFDRLGNTELEAWRLLQPDPELHEGVLRLLAAEDVAPKTPTHCDLRVDQFLLVGERLLITDWEEFRLADPARDVGGFAGEWLYRAILDIVTSRGDAEFLDIDFTQEVVLTRGVEKFLRLRPLVETFWQGYLEVRGEVDPEIAERATAYAGWHMIDRLIAAAAQRPRLLGIERAAAGIGRTALLAPERFVKTLGLGPVDD